MKNKLVTILLSVVCICASVLPNTLTNYNHIETESFDLEETSEENVWGELYRDNSVYQETYQRVYEETLANLQKQLKEQEEQRQKAVEQYNTQQEEANKQLQEQLREMDQQRQKEYQQAVEAYNNGNHYGNSSVRGVRSMKINANGHLIAYYTDGTQEDCGSVRENSSSNDFDKIGYVVPIADDFEYSNTCSYFDYEVTDISVKLVDIKNPNTSYTSYIYDINVRYNITNFRVRSDLKLIATKINISSPGFIRIIDVVENGSFNESWETSSSTPYIQINDFTPFW